MYLIRAKHLPFRARDGAKGPMRLVPVTGWAPFHALPAGVGESGNAQAEVRVETDESNEALILLLAESDEEAAKFSAKAKASRDAAAEKAHAAIYGRPKAPPPEAAPKAEGELEDGAAGAEGDGEPEGKRRKRK